MNWEAAALDVALFWMLTAPHEFAHAWTAKLLGDDTPEQEGRVTLNPLAHVDWLGTVILPLATSLLGGGFLGWGRPVNTNPSKLRWGLNGLALVALAGPFSNIIMALILGAVGAVSARAWPEVFELTARGAHLSIYLALFNMLPIPPLDGSKLLLAARIPWVVYQELARFGFALLIVAISVSDLGHYLARWSMEGTLAVFQLFR